MKKSNSKTAEAAGDLIGNIIANKIMGISKHLQQNNSEKVAKECDKKNLKKDMYLQKKDNKSLVN